MIPLSYNVRNLAVRKATTFASAFGLALVVFVFASVSMLSNGIKNALGRAANPDVAVILRKGSQAELESSIEDPSTKIALAEPGIARIKGKDAPDGVAELVAVLLLDKLGTTGFSNVTIRGVGDHSVAFRPDMKVLEGRIPQPGTDEVMVGRAIRGRFKGVDIGQSFDLRKNRPVKVVGVFEDRGSSYESEVWADLDQVRASFGREGLCSAIRVRLESPSKFNALKTSIEANRQLGLTVLREEEFFAKQSEGTAIFVNALGFLIAAFFSVGAMIGALITMHAAVAHRQREIGTLRALGFSRMAIGTSFVAEAVLLGVMGGAVGAGASLGMSFVKFSTMNFATWSEIVFAFEPTPAIIVRSMVVACVMGLVGGSIPAIRAARVSPVTAMRGA
jgi:putative ABC transport system permease protein